jgi:hypothetical protein
MRQAVCILRRRGTQLEWSHEEIMAVITDGGRNAHPAYVRERAMHDGWIMEHDPDETPDYKRMNVRYEPAPVLKLEQEGRFFAESVRCSAVRTRSLPRHELDAPLIRARHGSRRPVVPPCAPICL